MYKAVVQYLSHMVRFSTTRAYHFVDEKE